MDVNHLTVRVLTPCCMYLQAEAAEKATARASSLTAELARCEATLAEQRISMQVSTEEQGASEAQRRVELEQRTRAEAAAAAATHAELGRQLAAAEARLSPSLPRPVLSSFPVLAWACLGCL